MRKPAGKRQFQNALLIVVSVALSVGVAELSLRAWEARTVAAGDRLVPLQRLGYNQPPVRRARGRDETRILSFGDSFAYAIVHYPLTYHAIAARLLSAPGRSVSVVNLGEPSISLPQYLEAHRAWSAVLEHDAVLFNLYLGNDLTDIARGHVPVDADPHHVLAGRETSPATGERVVGREAVARLTERVSFVPHRYPLRLADHARALILSLGSAEPMDLGLDRTVYNQAVAPLRPEQFDAVARNILATFSPAALPVYEPAYAWAVRFARYAQAIAAAGTPVVVTLAPPNLIVDDGLRERIARRIGLPDDFDPHLPFALLEAIFETHAPAVRVQPLDAYLRCHAERGEHSYLEHDTHWNETGNALVGRAVATLMARADGLAPGTIDGETCPLGTPERPELDSAARRFLEAIDPPAPAP